MNYHKSIDTISRWNFVQARVHDDPRYILELDSYLNLDSIKIKEEWTKAYSDILEQYNNKLLERQEAASNFEYDKEIALLENEMFVCKCNFFIVKFFEGRQGFEDKVKAAIEDLSNYGYNYNGNIEALEGSIDSLLNDIDDILLIKKQINGDNKHVSEEQMVARIQKFLGLNIDTKQISVSQWLVYEDDYIKSVKDASNKAKSSNR